MVVRLVAPHLGGKTGKRRLDPLLQFLRVQSADRVLHHDQVRLDLAGLGLRSDQGLERLGRDYDRVDATFAKFDAVVETPR